MQGVICNKAYFGPNLAGDSHENVCENDNI